MRRSFGVGLWKAIRRGWDVIGNNLVYSVKNGRRVRFWKDKCGDDTLCTSFPSLFAISLAKEAWVEDVWSHAEGGVWVPRFSRQLNDWKVFNVEDQVVWTKARTKDFLLSLFTRHWNRKD